MEMIKQFSNKHGKKSTVTLGKDESNQEEEDTNLDDTIPGENTHLPPDDEVSDNSSELDLSDIDKVIDRTNISTMISNNGPGNSDVLSVLISDEYCEDEPVSHLPPIDENLSKILTKWLKVTPPRDKVKDFFKQCLLPCNVEGLLPVKINELVYKKLPHNYKINDRKLHGINTYFAHGLGPLVTVWNKILQFEAILRKKNSSDKIDSSETTISVKQVKLNFTDIRKDLDKSIHLLCTGHSVVLDKRRVQLRSFFDPKFHYLFKSTNPVTSWLLGDNIDQKIVESTKVQDAANKLQLKFRGSSRARPY